ncbi:MAG: hypothetical protein NTW87_35810, partial [Planctomycetota bacterium]|nr:hypothetical protein [Planctomycetota bacterium]
QRVPGFPRLGTRQMSSEKLVGRIAQKLAKNARRARTRVYWTWRNVVGRRRMARELADIAAPVTDLNRYERRICSQHGEDGILEALFKVLGTTNRYCVEFGVGSGRECNTAWLVRKHGWTGLWMDGNPRPKKRPLEVRKEFISAENITALFARYGVPREFDLLSIDIDGNDYWVWKKIVGYRPRVVVIEYNASVPPTEARVIPYDPNFVWPKTDYYGASLLALAELGRAKGYALVACDDSGANAFFVDGELAEGRFVLHPVSRLYRAATYRGGHGHPRDPSRSLIPVTNVETADSRG